MYSRALQSVKNQKINFSFIDKIPKEVIKEIKQIKNNLSQISDWKNINELIPKFYFNKKMQKSGLAGIFSASLELTKEGVIKILQKKIFEPVMIKKIYNK